MKYETPELRALPPAVNAIQGPSGSKDSSGTHDGGVNELTIAYEDWE